MKKHSRSFALISPLVAILLVSCGNAGNGVSIKFEDAKPAYMGNTVENLNNGGYVTYDSKYIYYTAVDEKGRPTLYKSDMAGKTCHILWQGQAKDLNVIDGRLYYSDYNSGNIYRISVGGGESQQLTNMGAYFMLAYKDRLYVIADYDCGGNHLYSMSLDGTDVKCLSYDKVSSMYIYEDSIYFSSAPGIDEKGYFSKMGLDDSNIERVFDNGYAVNWFCVYQDNIYYVGGYTFYKVDIFGNNQEKVADLGEVISNTYNFDNGTFYYSTLNVKAIFGPKPVMNRLDVNTGSVKSKQISFLNRPGGPFEDLDCLVGDKIFRNENGKLFIMNLDGSNIRAWAPQESVSKSGSQT